MKKQKQNWLWAGLWLAALILTACRQPAVSEPTAAAPTIAPALATVAAVPTATVTATAVPTITPSATPTAEPTATAVPTATATVTPTPTPAGVWLMALADFGADRNPFTGELMDNPAVLQRRPLAVKISNAPPSFVRPQSGLNEADLVFEHITEGSITRLTLLFYGQTPPEVGPIRSARLLDLQILGMYDAAFVFSGASDGVNRRLNGSPYTARILRSGAGYYRTGANKPFEHTLYGRLPLFWDQLDALGQNSPPNLTRTMAFASTPPVGGSPASRIELDYRWESVRWEYDPDLGRYRRWAADRPVIDANDQEQVAVANVIVVYANHVEDADICEESRDGVCLHLSVEIQIWGSGTAVVFRDGRQYNVTWQRQNQNDPLTFHDQNGAPFPLQVGNSWLQMMPMGWETAVQVSP